MATLTQRIKQYALNQGYAKAGVAPAQDFEEWVQEVYRRGTDNYSFLTMNNPSFFDLPLIRKTRPEAKSIIVLVWDYAQSAFPDDLCKHFGRVYLARCYTAPPHHINGARLALIKKFLADNGCDLVSGVFIPERLAGAKAGVVNYGKNSFSYADGIGSFVMLSALAVDRELDYDEPSMDCKCPPGCSRCLQACPTKAIYEPFRVNPRRCLAGNAFFRNQKIPGMSDYIPEDIREHFALQVHGCDICQEVCPRNQARLKARLLNDSFLTDLAARFSLSATLAMEGDYYETCLRPVAYNYLKNPAYFQRNAAVALGNSGSAEAVPALCQALTHERPFVRGHAAWGLGKIGGSEALRTLRRHAEHEDDPEALREVMAAVARIQNREPAARPGGRPVL
ncbi:MAG: HEAT repeat domain-containing protein [Desulfarculales bacterium]|jgi:epoxyqueuosine reductase|nr:HEAT repeat domain-containing protein [Desulfarculales bacterium]